VILSPTMTDAERLAAALAKRAKDAERRARQIGEFEVWRPTPNQQENDLLSGTGELTLFKRWDLSPISPDAFDGTEPPGRPVEPPPDPPINTALPLVIGDPEVAAQLVGSNGSWSGASAYSRQWSRDGTPIAGATAISYTLADADLGAMVGHVVTATSSAGGVATAASDPIGPVVEAPPPRRR
jgi:hypothetical protein